MPRLYGFEDMSRRRLRDDEVDAVRQMAARALAGQSDMDVAVWANAVGYRGTMGGEWRDASVGRLFANPAIAGLRYDDDGELVDADHPGMIEPEEFKSLQQRKSQKRAPQNDAHDYLLADGDSTCGNCSRSFEGARNNAGTPGYRCRPKDKSGHGGCGEVRIDSELLDTYVGEYVVAEILKPGIRAQISRAQESVRVQVEKLKKDIKELEGRRDEAATLYASRSISREAFVVVENQVAAEIKEAKARLRYAEQMANFSLGDAEDLVRWWNTAPTASKKAIIKLLLEGIVVFRASARGIRTIEPGRVVLRWRKLASISV
ncbi:recombinase family protein [Streptomyces sp. NPDC057638]|uniref:recombinase family protein n=1 Tax=Streptomyces sp. NPDC057638 TaxID=3346190 RepID=UPI0036775C70